LKKKKKTFKKTQSKRKKKNSSFLHVITAKLVDVDCSVALSLAQSSSIHVAIVVIVCHNCHPSPLSSVIVPVYLLLFIPVDASYSSNRMYYVDTYPILYFQIVCTYFSRSYIIFLLIRTSTYFVLIHTFTYFILIHISMLFLY
jgi:hypothetical protein